MKQYFITFKHNRQINCKISEVSSIIFYKKLFGFSRKPNQIYKLQQ